MCNCDASVPWLTNSYSIPSFLSESSREVFFDLDKVFEPPYSQEEEFADISQRVQSVLDLCLRPGTVCVSVCMHVCVRACVCVCVCVCGGRGFGVACISSQI